MATATSIISQACRKIGTLAIGETLDGGTLNECLTTLNTLIDSFPVDEFKQFTTQEIVVSVPSGSTSRTIGPGMQIDVPRPVAIMNGGFCRIGGIDYPFDVGTREQYAAIGLKTVGAHAPTMVYFDGDAPTGLLYFYPTPAGTVELHLPLQQQLSRFANASTDYTLPSGYQRFLVFALAREIAPIFEREVPPTVERTYQGLMRSIKRTNFTAPTLDMRGGLRRFNILGNTYS
jgi:hypothetical protein